jgi:hypothetical protein
LFAAPSLLRVVKVNGAEEYTAKNVFSYMWKILSHITWLWNVIVESQEANKEAGRLYIDL